LISFVANVLKLKLVAHAVILQQRADKLTRQFVGSTIVPYAGLGPYSLFGSGAAGAASIDRPFMANSGNADIVAEYSKVEAVLGAIPGVKYLVEYEGEDHLMSEGAFTDAYTWTKLFLDAFVKQDATAIEELSRARSINGSGNDSLVVVTEPDSVPPSSSNVATFANNILSIPWATVGDKYYSLDYFAGSSPVQFGLNSATEIASQTTTSGSFVNGVLVVPAVDVEGVSYRIELTLASDSPVLFTLTFAE